VTNKELGLASVSVLFLAHLMNDMYTNFLPQLTAILISSHRLTISIGALIVAVFTISSSISQPIFGYLIDQKGQRWFLYVGTLWMSVLLGFTGFISNTMLLITVAAAAGMGTAAFHPQAAAMVGKASDKNKGLVMSAFIAMGNLGLAISPLLLLPLFHYYGVQYTWLAIFPGVLAALLLYRFAPRIYKSKDSKSPGLGQVIKDLGKSSSELTKLIVIVALRSLVQTGLMTLLPVYFLARQYSPELAGYIIFTTLTAGAIGGVIGGYISDRFGRKPLIIGSMVMATVSFYGFVAVPGVMSFVFLALGGMALLSSFSVTVVIAQEIIPENAALASGLSMGFAVGVGGLGVSLAGTYAQFYGVESAVHLLFLLPLAAGLLALFLKKTHTNETPLAEA
jgi:FSR family fosmidomycin resistance protein-like MFS transporter